MLTFLEYVQGRKIHKKPFEKIGKYKVFTVDEEALRDTSQYAEEFNDYGIHAFFPKLIPQKEVWIGQQVKEGERFFLLHNALAQLKEIEKGTGKDKAYNIGIKEEKKLREQKDHYKRRPWTTDKPAPDKLYKEFYGGIPEKNDDIEVWSVKGRVVRDLWKVDFVLGGHGYVYGFVPNQEIWIEDGLEEDEIPVLILHEYVERTVMKYKHISYDKAHTIAAKVEFEHRGKFEKSDAMALNKEEALEMAKKFM